MLHPAPPWSGYLEAGTAGDISTAALPQCEAPSAAAAIPAGSTAAALALARSLVHPAAAALPLARAAALLRLSHTSVDRIDFWVSRFSGVGGLARVKEEPPAAGTGAHRRGTPLSILGFGVGAGGLEGWPGRRLRVVSGRRGGAGAGGSAGGGWRLRGCRLKMNCRPSLNYMSSASLLPLRSVSTVAFRFHSKFQFRQLSSESTVFTSSVVVRWFLVMLILHPFYIIYWRCY